MIQEGSPTLTLSHVNFGDVQILRHNPRDMSGVMGSPYAIHPVRMNQMQPVVNIYKIKLQRVKLRLENMP